MPTSPLEAVENTILIPKESTQAFLKRIEGSTKVHDVMFLNLDWNNPTDQLIMLAGAMRAKTPDEYESVVLGLWNLADKETNNEKKEQLQNYAQGLMNIGEYLYGIDWS